MNLFGAVSGAIAAINPQIPAVLRMSTGFQTQVDGTQEPQYEAPLSVSVQVQALSTSDLEQVENVNQQAEMRAVYLQGDIPGIDRGRQFGGDLLTFWGSDWLVTQQLEAWRGWSKVVVTKQV